MKEFCVGDGEISYYFFCLGIEKDSLIWKYEEFELDIKRNVVVLKVI